MVPPLPTLNKTDSESGHNTPGPVAVPSVGNTSHLLLCLLSLPCMMTSSRTPSQISFSLFHEAEGEGCARHVSTGR